ncbi:hypothetical protein JG688_00012653 [Phytophthora aleatoria]|uniref:Uncharacterized protein n=1 Tax=Phytophthora aleatoria TaxID=2496075 RepID=A0A8J5IY99_9STRA|nr:hypothetical protein JG688_00012653 [Phytophthora aleatoria]
MAPDLDAGTVLGFEALARNWGVFSNGSPDQQERGRYIAAKLLGQRLVMCGSVSFTWDSSTHQVVGLISQADMVSPLLQLMGNIEDVSNVLSNARVTPECNLVIGEYMLRYPLYC